MYLPLPLICIAVLGSSVFLTYISSDPSIDAWVTGLTLGLSGLVWMALPRSLRLGEVSLLVAIGVGLAMRLFYFASDPIREIDFLRYLWDAGAVQAGHS